VLRGVLGSLLVILGGTTVVLALAACVWAQLNLYAGQFDLQGVWLVGGAVATLGAAVLGAGVVALRKRPG
jgi:hypothetical protein